MQPYACLRLESARPKRNAAVLRRGPAKLFENMLASDWDA